MASRCRCVRWGAAQSQAAFSVLPALAPPAAAAEKRFRHPLADAEMVHVAGARPISSDELQLDNP